MIAIIRIVVFVMVLSISNAYAQDFQGVATYKTKRNVDLKLDSTKVNSDMQKQMREMLKKRFQKTFELSFNKEASVYKEEESLATPQVGNSNMEIRLVGVGGGSDILYKNTKNSTFTDQKDALGKIFLVKDKLKPLDWKLEPDTKYIGEYKCYKATFTREIEVVSHTSFNGASKVKDEATKKQMKTQTITAWYTPQIPVNNGPANYYGLPGLILEINTGQQQIVCSKIVLNPKDKIEIKEPVKGKEINQADYEKIMEKKRKEMMERFAPKHGRRGGESIEIRIGG
jgi:GLPGLI family protein